MKYEKEAATKNGRRTWKVTYELVHGPEPKVRRESEKVVTGAALKAAPKRDTKKVLATTKSKKPADKKNHQADKTNPQKEERVPKHKGQLTFF